MDSFFKDTYVIKFLRKLKVVLLSREWLWTVFKNCMSMFWERRNLVFRLSRTSFYFNFRVFSVPLKLKLKHGRMIFPYIFLVAVCKSFGFLLRISRIFFLKKCFMIFFIFYFLIFFSLVEIFWLEVKFQHLFITVLYLKPKALVGQ